MPRFDDESGSEETFAFDDSDFDDAFEAGKKKTAPPAKAKKAAASTTAKAAPKAKAAPAKKKKVALGETHTNGADSPASRSNTMDVDDDFEPAPQAKSAAASKSKKSASETYVKLTQLEHVLKRPDTYIGSVEPITQPMWVFDDEKKGLVYRNTTFVPGLYKIVDEILVNAADNKVRDSNMKNLKVTIDLEEQSISVYNDGQGIPIEIHSEEGIYIPELIFGHLLTSSNYDDDEAKVTGGRNGYGAKLANIYSTEFTVETASSANSKKYKQTFTANMSKKEKPKITANPKDEDWTKITFKPDLARFNMTELDKDTVALLSKRVHDMAGITKGVNVFLNGKKVAVRTFKNYVEMYINGTNEYVGTTKKKDKAAAPGLGLEAAEPVDGADEAAKPSVIYEKVNDRWEIAFAVSDGQFQQVSYCNAIATTKGGTHVDYVVSQIVDGVVNAVKKKNKNAPVKPFQIKNHVSIFVNCLIENPSFDSQTKENMTLSSRKFGSKCDISEDFLKKVVKSGVVENVLNWARFKEDQMLKKTDGHKRTRITGMAKLEDANLAGTKQGHKCTLILTEGDSAKALAVSGLGVVGRDYFGVFPLRGKLLNVREATVKSLVDNVEIQAIKQILGLQQGKQYTSTDSLRYGSVMIMADQDHDGSHIKGLIINFFDYWFPTLLKLPNFLIMFITPIVKVTRGKRELSFFTIPEYEAWKEETNNGQGWHIKYYKGLGTSTAADATTYFGNMRQHRIPFLPLTQDDRARLDMAFNKKKADDRKGWISEAVPGTFLDHKESGVQYTTFVDDELRLHALADNARSIPSAIDGFKPGQRKILFACFKRNLKAEIKVGQLAGYVSEHSAYHHGEQSLTGTIVGLAQNFVGSNNINLLDPNGQFGTRLQGGKDAASARYIFTNVAAITRSIFRPEDDNILRYLHDDGQSIEPFWYIPVIPMVLVNGSDGIGTGWSSTVCNYDPVDIVANVRRKLNSEDMLPMTPWYRGFRGTIEKAEKDAFITKGIITQPDADTVEITELPIRMWTQSYKEQLEAWIAGNEKTPVLIKDYSEYHTDTTVHFVIRLTEKAKDLISKDGLEKTFKLTSKVNTGNMHCFDAAGKIKKYASPEDIISDFYDVRLEYYHIRKKHLADELELQYDRLSNKARFVQMIVDDKLVINKRKIRDVIDDLRKHNFRAFPRGAKALVAGDPDTVDRVSREESEQAEEALAGDYHYLLSMPANSFTHEMIAKLQQQKDDKEAELTALLAKSAKDLWLQDLDDFAALWEATLTQDTAALEKTRKGARPGAKKGPAKKRKAMHDDDSDDSTGDFMPTKKAAAAAKPRAPPKKKVDLPPSDDGSIRSSRSRSRSVSVANAPVEVPKPKKAPAVVKAVLSDDEFAAPKAKAKVKATKAVVTKAKKAVLSDDDDDEDDFAVPKPKAKAQPKPKAPPAKKPRVMSVSDEEDDIFARPPKPALARDSPERKKTVSASMKPKASTSQASTSAPAARAARAAASKPKKAAYKMVLSDDDDEEDDSIMIDEDDEDESFAFDDSD